MQVRPTALVQFVKCQQASEPAFALPDLHPEGNSTVPAANARPAVLSLLQVCIEREFRCVTHCVDVGAIALVERCSKCQLYSRLPDLRCGGETHTVITHPTSWTVQTDQADWNIWACYC
jgi:hypothetical protein